MSADEEYKMWNQLTSSALRVMVVCAAQDWIEAMQHMFDNMLKP